MKTKNIILYIIVALNSIGVKAQQVKIIKSNTPTINIGGENLKVGDTFDCNKVIKWTSSTQVVIVRNADGRSIRIAAKDSGKDGQDIVNKLLQRQYAHLSSRGQEFPSGTYYIEDTLSIPLDLEEDVRPELQLVCNANGITTSYRPVLSTDGKTALISKDIFQKLNNAHSVKCKLFGIIDDEVVDLSEEIKLIPLEYAIDEE